MHAERKIYEAEDGAEMWFNGASDHLYEMQIPDSLPEDLRSKLDGFKTHVLNWGHGFDMNRQRATKKDVQWSIETAMNLLMEIDKLHGFEVEEADWK